MSTTSDKMIERIDRQRKYIGTVELIGIIGYSCFFSWYVLTAFDLFTQFPNEASQMTRTLLPSLIFFGMAISGLIAMKAPTKIVALMYRKPTLAAGAFSAIILPILSAAEAIGFKSPLPMTILACFLTGFVSQLFFTTWECTAGRIRVRHLVRFTGISLCVGDAIAIFAILATPHYTRGIFSAGLIIASTILLFFLGRKLLPSPALDSTEEPSKTAPKLDRRISVLSFVFGFSFGISWSMLVGLWPNLLLWTVLLSGLAVVVLITVLRKTERVLDRYVIALLRFCTAATGIACLVISVGMQAWVAAGTMLLALLWQVFYVVDINLLVNHSLTFKIPIMAHILKGKIANMLGFFPGWLAAALLVYFDAPLSTIGYLATGLAGVIVLAGMVLMPVAGRSGLDESVATKNVQESTTKPVGEKIDRDQSSKSLSEQCDELADLYALSPRESEVMYLFAKGRSIKAIAESLYISEHTAKSHVYNFYKKMDVHNKQQLLDLVEAMNDSRS